MTSSSWTSKNLALLLKSLSSLSINSYRALGKALYSLIWMSRCPSISSRLSILAACSLRWLSSIIFLILSNLSIISFCFTGSTTSSGSSLTFSSSTFFLSSLIMSPTSSICWLSSAASAFGYFGFISILSAGSAATSSPYSSLSSFLSTYSIYFDGKFESCGVERLWWVGIDEID